MNQNAIRTMAVLFACLCFIGCASLHRNENPKPLQTESLQQEPSASEYLNMANSYYNQAAGPGVNAEGRSELYKLSLENYKKALAMPEIDGKVKANVEVYIKETEELLAKYNYDKGYALVRFDMDIETKRANAPKAIEYFQKLIDEVPNTDYADLSYVQLGLCYEYLEKWDDAESAYEKLIKKYTDKNGYHITPFSENIIQAVMFAKDRLRKIKESRMLIS